MSTIYQSLSAVKILSRSYTFKFLFIAFLGIHIPLIGLISFILLKPDAISATSVFITTLLFTLAATGITLYVLRGLLYPLRQSRTALKAYYDKRELPNLPTGFQDEAGQLMKSIQQSITQLDGLLQEKRWSLKCFNRYC